MHCVPKGRPLAHCVHDAIGWARLIYLEHDKEESDRGLHAPPGSRPIALRLPISWPRIELKYVFDRFRVAQLSKLRPFALTTEVLDPVSTDEGVELVAMARSTEVQPPQPRIKYLETATESYALQDAVSDDAWDEAVSWALDNPASSKCVLETSYRAWIDGNFEELDRISSLHTRNRFAPIKHANITARNYLWLPTIRELVQSVNEPTLVLVGAAHLGGAEGLLLQLAACGLRLTEIAPR